MPKAKRAREKREPPLDATDLMPINIGFERFRDHRFFPERMRARVEGGGIITNDDAAAINQRALVDFIRLLTSAGSLKTIAINPRTGLRFRVHSECWRDCSLPERLILGDGRITKHEGAGFAAYSGCLAMISQSQLGEILLRDDLHTSVLATNRLAWGLPPPVKPPPKKRGRKKGSSPHEGLDEPIVREMRTLILSGKAATPHAAAWQLVEKAHGKNTSNESKVSRLRKRCKRKYPNC